MFYNEIPIINDAKLWFIPFSQIDLFNEGINSFRKDEYGLRKIPEKKSVYHTQNDNLSPGDYVLTKLNRILIIGLVDFNESDTSFIRLIKEVPIHELNLYVKDKIRGLRKAQRLEGLDSYIFSSIYPAVVIENRLVISLRVEDTDDIQAKKLGDLISSVSSHLIQQTELNENELTVKINVNSPGTILLIANFATVNSENIVKAMISILPVCLTILNVSNLLHDVYNKIKTIKKENSPDKAIESEITKAIKLLIDSGYSVSKLDEKH